MFQDDEISTLTPDECKINLKESAKALLKLLNEKDNTIEDIENSELFLDFQFCVLSYHEHVTNLQRRLEKYVKPMTLLSESEIQLSISEMKEFLLCLQEYQKVLKPFILCKSTALKDLQLETLQHHNDKLLPVESPKRV